jgi:short-subunit dehydrogenase
VDILISNAEFHSSGAACAEGDFADANAEMNVNYFGLLRLAQEFGPAMRAGGACAWVNLLSIYALANPHIRGTLFASKAAAYSFSQYLRAQMRTAAVRVVNVFPGPVADEHPIALPAPRLGPEELARAIVRGLQDGVEDIYPGAFAQEMLERWRENPKVLERELEAG